MIDRDSKQIIINLFYHTTSDNKCSFPSLLLFVNGDVAVSITVDVIFLGIVIDVIFYLAADVVFFATTIIVVTIAVTLVTIDTVSLVVITVIFVVPFIPTIRIDVVCHAVINVIIVDFFCQYSFCDIFWL